MDRSPSSDPIRVVVIDDHPLILEGTSRCLERDSIDVVGQASDGSAGLSTIAEQKPAVVILDLQLPDMSGVEVLRRLQESDDHPAVVVLTAHDEAGYLRRLLKLGIHGYLPKTSSCEQLISAIRAAARGRTVLMTESGRNAFTNSPEALTVREQEVLHCLTEGLSNAEISQELSVSERTVEFHVGHILQKLNARSRSQAIVNARRLGLGLLTS
jgi:two-component system, NarL family, response regulator DegU